MSEQEVCSLRALVHGRVQGVGFRAFVARQARLSGLQGYTRNLADGRSVEVLAEGERSRLELLLQALRQGPPLAVVERVDASWDAATGRYRGFLSG